MAPGAAPPPRVKAVKPLGLEMGLVSAAGRWTPLPPRARGAGWACPRAAGGGGPVPPGAFVFADPKRAMLPALLEEFREGDDDRLMKPIKQ